MLSAVCGAHAPSPLRTPNAYSLQIRLETEAGILSACHLQPGACRTISDMENHFVCSYCWWGGWSVGWLVIFRAKVMLLNQDLDVMQRYCLGGGKHHVSTDPFQQKTIHGPRRMGTCILHLWASDPPITPPSWLPGHRQLPRWQALVPLRSSLRCLSCEEYKVWLAWHRLRWNPLGPLKHMNKLCAFFAANESW
jgi:hypothetical protein